METLIWIATGALAGWSAGKLMKGRDYGWTGNILLGLIGSLVGGWLMALLGGSQGPEWWQRAIVAALGSVVVLGIARRLRPMARQTRAVLGDVAAASADLEGQILKLSELERRVVARMLQRQKPLDPNATFEQQLTFGQRVADKVASFGGSWTFIGLFLTFMLVWMIVNTEMEKPFDVFPFILLNLMLSCLAALQAPIIMMSQNRQAARDRSDARLDYEVNVRAETEIARLHEKIDLQDAEIHELLQITRHQLAVLERMSPHPKKD
ncbi:MAG TPA: DUF1003 domain-containing protein [Candidatus Eisenbacteria bacterium]|nr:DUF1003 domain-containing protein [Candidatus Eisenbacteria bacterium]